LANSSNNIEESSGDDLIKKKEKEMSKSLQETYKEDMQGESYELSKGGVRKRKSIKRDHTEA
jgi:hypothetical protein